jgi:hypothetical protein
MTTIQLSSEIRVDKEVGEVEVTDISGFDTVQETSTDDTTAFPNTSTLSKINTPRELSQRRRRGRGRWEREGVVKKDSDSERGRERERVRDLIRSSFDEAHALSI